MKSKHLLASLLCCMIWFAAYSETEPNNDRAHANNLSLNHSNSGAINPAADVDWWKITTTSDGQLNVTCTPKGGHFTYCQLYDNDGTTLFISNYSNAAFTISKDGLSPGIYYVKIFCFYNTDTSNYNVSNTLTSAPLTNDVEPDGLYTQANTVSLNGSITGHIGYYYNHVSDTTDWYKFTTNGDGLVKLNLAVSNGQYVYWQLFDGNGTTSLHSDYTNANASYSVDGLAAGTYYVKIFTYYTTGFAPYTLTDSLFKPAQANDAEPNGTSAQALTLPLNGSVTGHINYFYNGQYDTYDWYKLITTQDGMINLNFTSNNGQYVYWTLYDNDGTTLLNYYDTNGSYSYNTDGLAAGTYYVLVQTYYGNGWAPYTLSNTLTTYTNANDGLSNDYAKYAATLKSNNTTPGHVGFRYNGGSRDLIDWWKINYTGSGALTVSLNFESWLNGGGIPYTWLQVYKDTSAAPLFSDYSNTGNVTANLTGLTQGYYYVKVIPYYSNNWSSYNLTPTFTENCSVVTVKAKNKVSGTTCTNSSVKINCTGNHGPYKVQLYRYGNPYGSIVVANGSGDAQFSNLPPGTYTGRGYADGATCGTLSSAAKLVPLPTNPTTSNIMQTSVKFNWTTLTSCIEQSKVQYRVVGNPTWTTKKITNTNQNVTINGLTANTPYEWQVAAVDTSGGSTTTTLSAYVPGPNFTTLLKVGSSLDDQDASLSVYPNPASSSVHVSFENGTEGEVTMKLFDVNGRTVFVQHQSEASGNVNEQIDLSALNAGVYALQIITADGSVLNQSIVKTNE